MEHNLMCERCALVVDGGWRGFMAHLKRQDHLAPYVCGQSGCRFEFLHRSSLYEHIRVHHPGPPDPDPHRNLLGSQELGAEEVIVEGGGSFDAGGADHLSSIGDHDDIVPEAANLPVPSTSLVESAERTVLKLRSVTYMTTHAVQEVERESYALMKDTAAYLKMQVQDYLKKPDKNEDDAEVLLKSFDLTNPFKHIMTKPQQMAVFKEKFGLISPKEINLGHRFDSRLHPKRPRLEPRQVPTSFQYVSVKHIIQSVLEDPELRDLIRSEKASDDDYLRNFRDGSLYDTLPPDLKDAVRIVVYVDDLEILQALSPSAGAYKVAGIYFGIQNLPADVNAMLTYVFVTALAFADDAKDELVWKPFSNEMHELETKGIEIDVNGKSVLFKVVLIAQIGDSLAACEVLGFRHPSANCFCRICYINRKEMWQDGLKIEELRSPEKHATDVLAAARSEANRKATGVDGPSLLHSFRFFQPAGHSVFDVFHDLLQGVCKMEVKLALRYYICVKKYFTIQDLRSRVQFFDYGYTDKKNKPTTNLTEEYINNLSSYNLHQSGSQMWLLTRAFPFLLADLVPDNDPFMNLISLLNQIMRIVFSHTIHRSYVHILEKLIKSHHTLFKQIFPGQPEPTFSQNLEEDPAVQDEAVDNPDEEVEAEEQEQQDFQDFVDDLDDELVSGSAPQAEDAHEHPSASRRGKKKDKIVRMINKHHHMLHYAMLIHKFGPLVLYWCMRYEARHFFFKLIATIMHNHKNPLKTLMEMLQMKLAADKREPKTRLIMGKRGTKFLSVNCTPHFQELLGTGTGQGEFSKIYWVQHVTYKGIDYRPNLFVTKELEKFDMFPKFARIEGLYVSEDQSKIYVVSKQWKTVRFCTKFCAFEVVPDGSAQTIISSPDDFATYRLMSLWKRYSSSTLYLAPRTIA